MLRVCWSSVTLLIFYYSFIQILRLWYLLLQEKQKTKKKTRLRLPPQRHVQEFFPCKLPFPAARARHSIYELMWYRVQIHIYLRRSAVFWCAAIRKKPPYMPSTRVYLMQRCMIRQTVFFIQVLGSARVSLTACNWWAGVETFRFEKAFRAKANPASWCPITYLNGCLEARFMDLHNILPRYQGPEWFPCTYRAHGWFFGQSFSYGESECNM